MEVGVLLMDSNIINKRKGFQRLDISIHIDTSPVNISRADILIFADEDRDGTNKHYVRDIKPFTNR